VNDIKKIRSGEKLGVFVEFETKKQADYAKSSRIVWDDHVLQLESCDQSTLWCANYPPAADEKFMRDLFKDCGDILSVRFPSLQKNTRRRFCYVQFLRPQDAMQAHLEFNGKVLEDEYKLSALISDPDRKEERHSAQQEGREIYVRNLDIYAREDDVKEFFEQCGAVDWIRWPKALDGKHKTFAFVVFKDRVSRRHPYGLSAANIKV
jgi:squamous cell carcinoma antigen recognized by T-cells 3